ncbi:putative TerS [Pseudomonas phage PhL_UNISO_PA-DSM_ph0031]|nr:putative TerS [Pseudomonas phage PhL_UNISO_PA-DSM_ph0031]
MNANQQIEAFFLARKAEGCGNSRALDATVEHFAQYNPMYVRTHIRHCALWDTYQSSDADTPSMVGNIPDEQTARPL